jgi:hypothetical protein
MKCLCLSSVILCSMMPGCISDELALYVYFVYKLIDLLYYPIFYFKMSKSLK